MKAKSIQPIRALSRLTVSFDCISMMSGHVEEDNWSSAGLPVRVSMSNFVVNMRTPHADVRSGVHFSSVCFPRRTYPNELLAAVDWCPQDIFPPPCYAKPQTCPQLLWQHKSPLYRRLCSMLSSRTCFHISELILKQTKPIMMKAFPID